MDRKPLIALFFAVEEDAREGRQSVVYQYPVRSDYMADKKTSPLNLDHTRVMKVETHSHRAAAQAVCLTRRTKPKKSQKRATTTREATAP